MKVNHNRKWMHSIYVKAKCHNCNQEFDTKRIVDNHQLSDSYIDYCPLCDAPQIMKVLLPHAEIIRVGIDSDDEIKLLDLSKLIDAPATTN